MPDAPSAQLPAQEIAERLAEVRERLGVVRRSLAEARLELASEGRSVGDATGAGKTAASEGASS